METTAQSRDRVNLELAEEVLHSFGNLRFVAQGTSMIPSIFPGDILLVQRERINDVRRGDVVLYSRGGRFYAHRLVRKTQECEWVSLVTQGDALSEEDPAITENELLGQVREIIRGRNRIGPGELQGPWNQILCWVARRSDGAAKWLVRWNTLCARIAGNSDKSPAKVRGKSME